jgi:hypothetical protein
MRVHTLLKRWRILLWPVLALGAGAGGCFYYFQPPVVTVSAAEHAPVSGVVDGTGTAVASVDRTRSMSYDASDARPTVEDSAPSRASTPITRDVRARASEEGPRRATNHATSARVPPTVKDARRIAAETADRVDKEAAHKARWARSKVERTVVRMDVKRITRIGRDLILSLL